MALRRHWQSISLSYSGDTKILEILTLWDIYQGKDCVARASLGPEDNLCVLCVAEQKRCGCLSLLEPRRF